MSGCVELLPDDKSTAAKIRQLHVNTARMKRFEVVIERRGLAAGLLAGSKAGPRADLQQVFPSKCRRQIGTGPETKVAV
jgi:hypothetical protein